MEWTIGSMMFYGGAACAGLTFLVLIVMLFVFRGGKKRLRRKLDEEYGKGESK